jgi:hypothetical protein
MDMAMVLGGAVIALLQGMDADGAARVANTFHNLANRESCSPAERHIFQVIAEAVDQPPQNGFDFRKHLRPVGGAA